LGHPVYLTTR